MFGTASKWIGIYNIWYYGVLMALNGNEAIITFHYFLLKGKKQVMNLDLQVIYLWEIEVTLKNISLQLKVNF